MYLCKLTERLYYAPMSWIKDKYHQFRNWQENPFEYHDGHDRSKCCNCGAEIENNYCPRCGQKTTYGPITWRSMWQGIMDVWGMGSRSLPYTLWQLIWRPGYLIRDYISGKRQVSFPPVKMLVIVAICAVFISDLIFPEDEQVAAITSTGLQYYVDVLDQWMNKHLDMNILAFFSLLILPVWFLFRRAPKFPCHSIPQGFFIQVFTSVQYIILPLIIISLLLFFLSKDNLDSATSIVFAVIAPIIIYCDYRQLFGYGRWGTLWRMLLMVPLALSFVRVFVLFTRFLESVFNRGLGQETIVSLVVFIDRIVFLWLLLEFVTVINNKSWREQGLWLSFRRPLLAAGVLLLTTLLCVWVSNDNSFISLFKSIQILIGE